MSAHSSSVPSRDGGNREADRRSRRLVLSPSQPMINHGRALSAEPIVTILLDGLPTRPEVPPVAPEPHPDDTAPEVHPC